MVYFSCQIKDLFYLFMVLDTIVITGTIITDPIFSPANCQFESSNLCNYIQDKTDVFDWSWQSGSTRSTNTGPANDHTYGTGTGIHIIYILP